MSIINTAAGILVTYPGPVCVLATALLAVFLTDRGAREILRAALCLVPLLPLFALRLAAAGVVAGIDRLLVMRWADPFVGPARRLARPFEEN